MSVLLLPVSELIALPYETSPFSQGLTSDDFRARHREIGEPVRWWKGFEDVGEMLGPNGESANRNNVLYIEQQIAPEVRVLIFEAQEQTETTEFGLIAVGDARISALPDEIELARGDVIARIHPKRAVLARTILEPSGAATDDLGYGLICEILGVYRNGAPFSVFAWEKTDRGLRWTGAAPTEPVLVEFRYFPAYEFQGQSDKMSPLGTDGKLLPKIGPLRLLKPGEEFLK